MNRQAMLARVMARSTPWDIVVIGGGSFQWVPKLFCDLVNTPSLAEAEIVLEDIAPEALADMAEFAGEIVARAGVGMSVQATTDQRAALAGADYVVVCISTGGFADSAAAPTRSIASDAGDSVSQS